MLGSSQSRCSPREADREADLAAELAKALWGGDEVTVATLTPVMLYRGPEVVEEDHQAPRQEQKLADRAWRGYGERYHDRSKRIGARGQAIRKKAV